jgi:predicted P-loop ATPase
MSEEDPYPAEELMMAFSVGSQTPAPAPAPKAEPEPPPEGIHQQVEMLARQAAKRTVNDPKLGRHHGVVHLGHILRRQGVPDTEENFYHALSVFKKYMRPCDTQGEIKPMNWAEESKTIRDGYRNPSTPDRSKKPSKAPDHSTDEASPATEIWQGWTSSRPTFDQTDKGIVVNATQTRLAVECPSLIGMVIAYDEFADTIIVARRPGEWEPMNDAIEYEIRMMLESAGFRKPEKQLVKDAIHYVACHNRMDTAMEWIQKLPPHDGVPRLDTFFRDYFEAEQNLYAMGLGRYIWTAMAGRILHPGIKADNVPVLIGPQGIRKSSAVEAMAPSRESFMILSLAKKDEDISRSLRGIILGEWGELAGMKPKDIERIKNFCSQTRERWIPKFKEYSTTFPRRCVFIATTNEEQFLADPTGNRRFFPIRVRSCDPEAISRDRDQLWAEAVGLFKSNGIEWKGVTALGAAAQRDHEADDPWQSAIADWLAQPIPLSGDGVGFNAARRDLTASLILHDAINKPVERQDAADTKRVGAIMRKLNFDYRKGVNIAPGVKGAAYRRKE